MLNESRAKRAIVRCCSSQDTLHVPPEHRKFRRVHGLQLPLHPQQVVGWILLITVFSGTFTVLLTTPPLLPDLHFILLLLFAALFLLHVLAHLTVLLLDPADPEVRVRLANEVVPEFDRTKHRHVIENGRCHLCNITTRGQRTKHCSICNKCVPRFDHHCKWLNNCIGGRNYTAFLACLVSTLVAALAVTAFALSELVLVNARLINDKRGGNNYNDTNMNNATALTPSLPVPGAGPLVLVTVIGVLSAIAAVLLIHLCFFHGYIACLGLTTYEYVRSKRDKNIANSRSTSSGDLCGTSYCAGDGEDIDRVASTQNSYSRCCKNSPLFRDGANTTTRMTTATTDVYVCSMHEEMHGGDNVVNGKDTCLKTLSSTKSSRNFHLCFSYDLRTTETSIEVSSSRATDATEFKNHEESPDAKSSSTPSPVSCCFSIMNHPENRHNRSSRKRRTSEHRSESSKRSCGTMKRIQTFLQAHLRKGSRQRSTPSSPAIARHCGNKIIPQASSPPDITPTLTEDQNRIIETSTMEPTLPNYPRLPTRLPALDFPRAVHKIRKISPNPGDISILGSIPPSTVSKRNQVHLRTRRSTSFSRKRPRFKVGSHVTQTTQLSPIPESEFSKPATPRSPSRSDSVFTFPPLHE